MGSHTHIKRDFYNVVGTEFTYTFNHQNELNSFSIYVDGRKKVVFITHTKNLNITVLKFNWLFFYRTDGNNNWK